MDSNIAQNEPMVIVKTAPFYRSIKFLSGVGIFSLVLLGFGGFSFLQKYTTPPSSTLTQSGESKPIKGIIGTVEAIDKSSNMLTIKDQDQKQASYQVSNDVLISQLVLGVKSEEMKQFSMPTETLYLEDLTKKKGAEVYLVFDSNGQKVVQIQMYPKLADKK